jgi:hypothetical protein
LTSWAAAALLLTLGGAQIELDCGRPGQARHHLGRLRLAEIEGAEDIHRAAMWEAFGRCPAGAEGEACREATRQRFGAAWDQQRQAIEAKYRRMLAEFEERCRSSIGLEGVPIGATSWSAGQSPRPSPAERPARPDGARS